jgi:hypothetical protein
MQDERSSRHANLNDWPKDQMKLIIRQSIAGGLLILTLAIGGAVLTGDSIDSRWLAESFVWIIAWPMALFRPLYPNSEDASNMARVVRLILDTASPLLVFLTYSSFIYAILWWRAKRKFHKAS